jgi:hypothetical protein
MLSPVPLFTPGPWTVAPGGYSIVADDGHIAAILVEGRSADEAQGNARLIKAAPDLVIALIALLRSKDEAAFNHARRFAVAILAQIDTVDGG